MLISEEELLNITLKLSALTNKFKTLKSMFKEVKMLSPTFLNPEKLKFRTESSKLLRTLKKTERVSKKLFSSELKTTKLIFFKLKNSILPLNQSMKPLASSQHLPTQACFNLRSSRTPLRKLNQT